MTREEIIDGLQYTIDMFCFNPSTGEVTDKNRLNDESRLTVDACEGAIEIIKALEQQPCGNAIDRAEAIKIASGYCHPANVAKELAKLPSVNPTKTGWISVSERVPEDSGEYLVTVIDEDVETYKHTGIAWYAHPKDYDVKEGDWRELMIDEKVIAWMPLPKPYEPQESEG